MPFIEEENLVKLYDEVETLSEKKEELRKAYIDLKLKNKSLSDRQKYLIFTIIGILLLLIFLFFNFKKKKEQQFLVEKEQNALKIDSIQKMYKANYVNVDGTVIQEGLIYTIQIGAFKDLDLTNYSKEELKNFRRLTNNGLHTYSVGSFKTKENAEQFLKVIRKIGIRDAFLVPLKDGNRITLKQALLEE